ncbi:MAG: ketopantoate reductase family protein [Acidimicrobiia bacterium]|nr:ketopantoate reductase family protein [Acidimicrobiia bacterium]
MRIVVVGAGAVGGVIGARLHQHGLDVTLVARGAHLDALASSGLRLIDGFEDVTLAVPAVASPGEIAWAPGDVAIVATKTQDAEVALDELRASTLDVPITVLTATNGVEAERMALRRFPDVVGVCVALPGTFLEPGVIIANSSPIAGYLQIGRYPDGADPAVEALARTFDSPGLAWRAVDRIMDHKYGKLLMNLGNVLDAVADRAARDSELGKRARAEARQVFEAAGIEAIDDRSDWPEGFRFRPTITGEAHRGSSTWQSLVKGGRLEVDYFNGEIVLLGRLHGVPTPVNELLSRIAVEQPAPRSLSVDDLAARLTAVDAR